MHDRQAYEDNVITEFANMFRQRRPGISDDDLGREYEGARRFYNALAAFEKESLAAAEYSELRGEQIREMLEILRDAAPSMQGWEDAISNAKRGY